MIGCGAGGHGVGPRLCSMPGRCWQRPVSGHQRRPGAGPRGRRRVRNPLLLAVRPPHGCSSTCGFPTGRFSGSAKLCAVGTCVLIWLSSSFLPWAPHLDRRASMAHTHHETAADPCRQYAGKPATGCGGQQSGCRWTAGDRRHNQLWRRSLSPGQGYGWTMYSSLSAVPAGPMAWMPRCAKSGSLG
jgi:hypothetical protein